MTLSVYVDAVGTVGPGGSNWAEWRAILSKGNGYQRTKTVVPPLYVLPSAERRRVGTGVKIALASGLEALTAAQVEPATITTVFSSSGGDGENCHWICETLASEERLISPTRFHNSVHNAPSGYWGIASGAMLPSTSLCAYDASFSVGLLDAAVQCATENLPVLLVAYDTPYPEPLNGVRFISDQFAVSMLLSPVPTHNSMASMELNLGKAARSIMDDPELEHVRMSIPAARCLPVLQRLAVMSRIDGSPTDVYLEYLDQQSLHVVLSPVRN
jgi:hypothetical protein